MNIIRHNTKKVIMIALFVILMFTNIKIALLNDNKIFNNDISVLGIKMELFEGTYATSGTVVVCYPAAHAITYGPNNYCLITYWFTCTDGSEFTESYPC